MTKLLDQALGGAMKLRYALPALAGRDAILDDIASLRTKPEGRALSYGAHGTCEDKGQHTRG
ncbi:MAG TPA: hypothetical protein VGG01_12410 [Xanthobacteraceae bacterium]